MKKAIGLIVIITILGGTAYVIGQRTSGVFAQMITNFLPVLSQTADQAIYANMPNYIRSAEPTLDTEPQNILLIGDSMAFSLMFRFSDYCKENNHEMHDYHSFVRGFH